MRIDPSRVACDVCGRPSSAVWYGERDIHICSCCARDHLPGLMADALPIVTGQSADVELARIERSYWRAIALRLDRERREVVS